MLPPTASSPSPASPSIVCVDGQLSIKQSKPRKHAPFKGFRRMLSMTKTTLPIDIPRESPFNTPLDRSYQSLSSFSEASRCSSATSLSSCDAFDTGSPPSVPLPADYQRPWQETVAMKRSARAAKLPEAWLIPEHCLPGPEVINVTDWCNTCGFFGREELLITNSTACEIVENIASGHWTSMAVLQAFCHRAAVAQRKLTLQLF